ncbi:hypothetical protein CIK84_09085 [Glutamicibacter arilaitensis]|uniref:Uncharacterized protein n=1 Tax=Glutamicibacter arilaitensis TaxID=256701 RepID=A0A2N7S6B2_9MICC|nr:hypothetical protein CIK84_09085 [Glutamicibacter arilaitensis]
MTHKKPPAKNLLILGLYGYLLSTMGLTMSARKQLTKKLAHSYHRAPVMLVKLIATSKMKLK